MITPLSQMYQIFKSDAVKMTILASDILRSVVSGCVTFYRDFLTHNEGVTVDDYRNILGIDVGDEDDEGGGNRNGMRSGVVRGGGV